MCAAGTMKAVVFDGSYNISLQDRPVPRIQDDRDIIVQVDATALCGSELHVYRGHQASGTGFIMGHEFTGTVIEAGTAVRSLRVGDKVVSPFTVSCGRCYYCNNGGSGRCVECRLFGTPSLDGAQAEYVRVPLADTTAVAAPATIADEALILMADIFPTGYFGVKSGLEMLPGLDVSNSTIVVIGCGPVGLCALVAASNIRPRHLFAIDSVRSRLEQAQQLGAEPLDYVSDKAGVESRIRAATDGRGADLVIEAVGLSPALRTAFDLVRPFGAISSIGVHNQEIPWSGKEAYAKNVRLQMGRCPVRSVFGEALALLREKQHLLRFMAGNVMPLSEAADGYTQFDQAKVSKVVFKSGS